MGYFWPCVNLEAITHKYEIVFFARPWSVDQMRWVVLRIVQCTWIVWFLKPLPFNICYVAFSVWTEWERNIQTKQKSHWSMVGKKWSGHEQAQFWSVGLCTHTHTHTQNEEKQQQQQPTMVSNNGNVFLSFVYLHDSTTRREIDGEERHTWWEAWKKIS